MNELTTEKLTNEIAKIEGKYSSIITKGTDPNALSFKTIDDKALQTISDWMPVVNEKVSAFSKQNSQTTTSLMTLNMVDAGPYRALRQILAQVEKKRAALKEAMFRMEKNRLTYEELNEKISEAGPGIKGDKLYLRQRKIASDLADSTTHIEASLKELGAYEQRYNEIVKNNDIPENWSEAEFEEAEIEHHIKSIFRNGIRDRLQGSHNMGTMEYMEQFGLNPITAYACIDKYIADVRGAINNTGQGADVNALYVFLDAMYDSFKDEYKKAMNRLGLDSITHADFLMKNGV